MFEEFTRIFLSFLCYLEILLTDPNENNFFRNLWKVTDLFTNTFSFSEISDQNKF